MEIKRPSGVMMQLLDGGFNAIKLKPNFKVGSTFDIGRTWFFYAINYE